MTAQVLSSDGTALGNPHFYYGRGVSGDDVAIMQDRKYVKRTAGQLWERVAEREPEHHVTTGQFRRRHTLSSPVWAFLPLSPAGWCKFYREMDVKYNTAPRSPLHHDGRCPVHNWNR